MNKHSVQHLQSLLGVMGDLMFSARAMTAIYGRLIMIYAMEDGPNGNNWEISNLFDDFFIFKTY